MALSVSALFGLAGLGHYFLEGPAMDAPMQALIWAAAGAATVLFMATILVKRQPVGPRARS